MIDWFSGKQYEEAEYTATIEELNTDLRMLNLVEESNIYERSIKCFVDSQSAIKIVK